MKIYSIAFCIAGVILISCNGDDPVELPTCTDDIQNGTETGVDCGGTCVECFDCFSNFCAYLSGGIFSDKNTSIKWKYTKLDEELIDDCDVTNLGCEIMQAQRFTFHNKGNLDFTATDGQYEGRWRFDDPEGPGKIFCEFPDDIHQDITLDIVSLKENELKVTLAESVGTMEPVN